jgi:crotonobetainyl-CoA:carnitine CoA-transferase CaiB-like acyl-CoA transferase
VTRCHGGAVAAAGVLFALWDRERSGEGQHIDVSLQELMLMPNMSHPAQAWVQGYRGQRSGNANRVGDTIQPEIWPCKDGFVSFALRGGRARIPGLVAIVQYMDEHGMAPPVLKERDWSKHNSNLLTQPEVDAIAAPFAAFFKTKTMQELYDAACTRRLMLAPANTEREVLDSRQLKSRSYFTDLAAPRGRAERLSFPARFAVFPLAHVGERAPSLDDGRDGFSKTDTTQRPTGNGGRSAQGAGIFAGLKIVEFGAGAAAPLATRYFADQGATVVKIESRQRPDFLRTLRDDGSGKLDSSLFFACLNPNKLSAGLNMKDPRAIALAKRLVGWGDVVIENFAPGVMQKWGLGYDVLSASQPGLIMISTCLWGQTGPERAYPGFGGQGSALAGFNYLTGWPDREPLGPFGTITDSISPRFAAVSIAAALLYRNRTGRGTYIDLSQVETGIYGLGDWLLGYSVTGESFARVGNRSRHAAPHGVFPCAGDDRWIALAVHSDDDWQRLVRAMGAPAWATASELVTVQGRLDRIAMIEQRIAEWTSPQDAVALAAKLQSVGLDAAVVADMQDLLKDPQLAARGHFHELSHPVVGRHVVESYGLWSRPASRCSSRVRAAARRDSEEVYRELLGLSRAEVQLATGGAYPRRRLTRIPRSPCRKALRVVRRSYADSCAARAARGDLSAGAGGGARRVGDASASALRRDDAQQGRLPHRQGAGGGGLRDAALQLSRRRRQHRLARRRARGGRGCARRARPSPRPSAGGAPGRDRGILVRRGGDIAFRLRRATGACADRHRHAGRLDRRGPARRLRQTDRVHSRRSGRGRAARPPRTPGRPRPHPRHPRRRSLLHGSPRDALQAAVADAVKSA